MPGAGDAPQNVRMRRLIVITLQATAAVVLGLASAWAVLRSGSNFGAAAGPWRVSVLAGSPDADLYTRARVAIGGLLALKREETMYYLAETDSEGQRLRSRCRYRVSGTPPAARWWSVTAYADDFFLFPNAAKRYSVNGGDAMLDAQGRFSFVSAPNAPVNTMANTNDHRPDLWVPTPGDRGLFFTLRVYNPEPALAAAPHKLAPPRIERLGSCT